jgi:hypothetical protein
MGACGVLDVWSVQLLTEVGGTDILKAHKCTAFYIFVDELLVLWPVDKCELSVVYSFIIKNQIFKVLSTGWLTSGKLLSHFEVKLLFLSLLLFYFKVILELQKYCFFALGQVS